MNKIYNYSKFVKNNKRFINNFNKSLKYTHSTKAFNNLENTINDYTDLYFNTKILKDKKIKNEKVNIHFNIENCKIKNNKIDKFIISKLEFNINDDIYKVSDIIFKLKLK